MSKEAYPKWVGVALGLLLSGAAHYMAGDRRGALEWYFSIGIASTAGIMLVAVPGAMGLSFALIFLFVAFALWVIMLRQSYRPLPRIGLSGWLAVIVLAMLLGAGWHFGVGQVVRPFRVSTAGMMPVIMPGDHVMAERLTYRFGDPRRGDIVVFTTQGIDYPAVKRDTYYIQRVAGLPGESIRIAPPDLIVDGTPVLDPPVFRGVASHSNGFQLARTPPGFPAAIASAGDRLVLGAGEYLTLGDHTSHSLDGRYFGAVSRDQVYGRVTRIYWPLSRMGLYQASQQTERGER